MIGLDGDESHGTIRKKTNLRYPRYSPHGIYPQNHYYRFLLKGKDFIPKNSRDFIPHPSPSSSFQIDESLDRAFQGEHEKNI